MAFITLGSSRLVLGTGNNIILGSNQTVVIRGDDAGTIERFWKSRAEAWLDDHIDLIKTAKKPQARRTIIIETLAEASAMSIPLLPLAALDAFQAKAAATRPDYTALAGAILVEMEQQKRVETKRRKNRDAMIVLLMGNA